MSEITSDKTMTQTTPPTTPPSHVPHSAGSGNGHVHPTTAAVHQAHGGHEDEIPTDLPKVGTPKIALVAIAFVVLLGALFVIGYLPHRQRIAEADKVATEQNDVPVVDVVQPKRVESAGDLVLPADARALQDTPIYPRANGYLKRLLVDIGDHVKAGQLLAEIDTPEVDAQLNAAQATLQQVKTSVNKSQADFALAKSTLDRYESLANTGNGAVTQQDVDEKRAGYDQANAALDAAKANVTASEAEVQRLNELKSWEKVTAPFGGVISARNYDVGALLSPSNTGAGKELFRITQSDTLRVFVNVPQSYASAVKLGQAATLQVRSFPGRKFQGKVTRTSGTIDPMTRTLRTQIDVPNPDQTLYSGMYGMVSLPVHEEHPPLVVPTSAMMFQSDGTRVALVEEGKIRMQKITVGRDLGQELEVTEGLSGNEKVVTNPGERLAEGVSVEIAQPEKKDVAQSKTQTAQR